MRSSVGKLSGLLSGKLVLTHTLCKPLEGLIQSPSNSYTAVFLGINGGSKTTCSGLDHVVPPSTENSTIQLSKTLAPVFLMAVFKWLF